MDHASSPWLRYGARTLSLLWAGFWIWFGAASGMGEHLTPAGVFMHALPGFVFLLLATVAWRWERAGGWLLAISAVLIAGLYLYFFRNRLTLPIRLVTASMLALPPLAAGLSYLWINFRARRPGGN
jgi:hypothetical protein